MNEYLNGFILHVFSSKITQIKITRILTVSTSISKRIEKKRYFRLSLTNIKQTFGVNDYWNIFKLNASDGRIPQVQLI
uniref:Uncharacterized protein n=1 Tax=Ascaris lumbricoides TaxID=6252 RepID=A0A0M3IPR3_ASCLU